MDSEKGFEQNINMFLINFEQQAVCLKKKISLSKEENIIAKASTSSERHVLAALFFHDDITQIRIIPQMIFSFHLNYKIKF